MVIDNKLLKGAWYDEHIGFFGSGYLWEYENDLVPSRTNAEVDFLEKNVISWKGAKILDCPCGHGRHSVELARRGYNTTGVDINLCFLNEASKAAAKYEVAVCWKYGDMRDARFHGEFDVVLNLFTSFGYFCSQGEDQKVIESASRALKSKGIFVLDVMNYDRISIIRNTKKRRQISRDLEVVSEKWFDRQLKCLVEMRSRIWSNGKCENFMLLIRVYSLSEIIGMLLKSNFSFQVVYGDYDGSQFSAKSMCCIVVARKQCNM